MQMVLLKIKKDNIEIGEHRFEEHDTIVAGRSRDCHVLIENDNFVSRHHLLMEVAPPEIRLRDFGSLNGTYVNGEKIGSRAADETPGEGARRDYREVDLEVGDEVRLGDTIITFAGASKPEPEESLELPLGGSDAERIARFLFHVESEPSHLGTLGDYRIIKELGRGGFGVVFLGEEKTTKRKVAVKLMIIRGAAGPKDLMSFEREIRNSASLSHPNIVEFLGFGHHDAMFYFVMEFCEDGDLGCLVKRRGGGLPVNSLKTIFIDALRGLAYAHSEGFVHRDLKPENLLLSNGTVKIADFGLAKNFEKAGLSGFTLTGQTAGTSIFMPREQLINFKYVEPTSDVWSMGATFFYLLTGETVYPFSEDRDPFEVILSDKPRRLWDINPNIPTNLAAVIDKSLNVNPKQRYQNAREFLVAVSEVFGLRME